MGWRRQRLEKQETERKGAHGRRMSNKSPPAHAPLSLPPLIISGSVSVLILGYFYSFSHFHENSSGTNRPTCVSGYAMLRTIEEEKWGMWVHSRWKLQWENTGISEVFSHMFSNEVFLLDRMQRGGLEELSFGFDLYTLWQAVETFQQNAVGQSE